MYYEEITLDHLDEMACLYVDTFNAAPWYDKWTFDTAKKRLQQMINTEDSYGLCLYQDGMLCGVVLGAMEQFFTGTEFNLKEFWVKNELRGRGLGTKIFKELENRLKARDIDVLILFTAKGDMTEHFYRKQQMTTIPEMILMRKNL